MPTTRPSIVRHWSVPREWEGDRSFIICGGPSVAELDLARLFVQRERVIVINSSYVAYPSADYLIFADQRWWEKHKNEVNRVFTGTAVAMTPMMPSDRYKLLERQRTSG